MANKRAYRTRAQEELLEFLETTPGIHHTAAEIKEYFSKKDKPIGMATIYRQLERFVDEGRIRKFILGPGESACYAYAEEQPCKTQFHCKCEVCGMLFHLDCDELREIEMHLFEHHGFVWNTGKTVFYGICDQCRKA